ncbi:MAG: D-glycerate dehydrogenase [Rhodobacteraceae bacterium]|nr:D-glycerate dehydrogenase [Paracoccaceae bacterium]
MSKPRIIVTRKLPFAVEERLKKIFTVSFNASDKPFSNAKLVEAMKMADGVMATLGDNMDAEVMEAGAHGRAKIVANFGVGVNHIDLDAAADHGIIVTNTPDVLTDATADIAMTLMLNVTRRTWEHENTLRRGDWSGFDLVSGLGMSLRGKTLGILGMGRIGQAVATRAYFGFGMKIAYFNRSKIENVKIPGAQAVATIEDLMEMSDVVSLHLPGGADNRHTISRSRLALMKNTAYLVNTARGEVIDETALIEALQQNLIAGAGLDVFENEPEVPQALRDLVNVSLLPHIGSATLETRNAMGMCAIDNLVAYFQGIAPPNKLV